ncbi:tRNA (adenosine(37)-N6)-dimethylallyltransferase MiaA [Candidatus Nomurabacteria bacterium]|nr:tRNA (adenosine(37)-N6)-dimethylallyltransferase MiaA [Candidatus Nomurabacteria bacterium]
MKKSQIDLEVLAQRFASSNKKPLLLVISGPTSSGKTDVSISIAKGLKKKGVIAEIVSADSRQIYKGLDLLSGKVTKKEMSGTTHYMLDVANPKRKYSVAEYQKQAKKIISQIIKKGHLPILVGGTGFYIDSITKGIVLPEVKPDTKLRKDLDKLSTNQLFSILKKLDSERAKNIDKHNKVRLIRSIEIAKSIGKVPKLKEVHSYEVVDIYVDLPDSQLQKRIKTRIEKRLKSGMLEEAQRLVKSGVSLRRMHELGLECHFAALYIEDNISKKDLKEELYKATWQYVKRQRTWFKKF